MNISVFGKTIVRRYDHYLYRLSYGNLRDMDEGRLEHYELTSKNLDTINASKDLRTMMKEQPEYLYGLGFLDSAGNVVGHAFMMSGGQKYSIG